MNRDAKLYLLIDKDWKPLADLIEKHLDNSLKNDVTIFQLFSVSNNSQDFAVLSLSDKSDKVVEQYASNESDKNDSLRTTLHEYYGDPLYGDKRNLTSLKKLNESP